jgi:hypothetical protein
LAGEPNHGGRFPETLPRMVAESTLEPNTNGYENRLLKQKQRIYLLKTIIQKIKKYAKTDGQEDLFETSDWQLCLKSANLDISTTPPNLIWCQAGPLVAAQKAFGAAKWVFQMLRSFLQLPKQALHTILDSTQI